MAFIDWEDVPPNELAPGVRIRAPYGQNLMISRVEIDEGAIVPTHHHPHEQGGIVLSGRMAFTIGDETRILKRGEAFLIPPNVPHGVAAVGGPVVALDIFTPVREDYAELANRFIPPVDSER